jgi:hypothetical protein
MARVLVIALSLASLGTVASETPLYQGLGLAELEKLEYDRPDDPVLKQELARHYWCHGEKGLAIEHWRGLMKTSPSKTAQQATERLKMSSESPKILSSSLCKDYPQRSL